MTTLEDRRPLAIDRDAAPGQGEATLTSSRDGEVFLRDAAGAVLRPRWNDGGAGGRRSLPAGRYRLLGYRVVSGDWFISTTGGNATLALAAGEERALDLDPTIRLEVRATRQGDTVSVQVALRSAGGAGLTIYRGGRRIALPFTIEGSRGEEVASGEMRYG